MDDSGSHSQLIPLTTVVILAAAAGGYLFIPKPMKTFRPEVEEAVTVETMELEDVGARLWQDPFTAVTEYKKETEDASELPQRALSRLRQSISSKIDGEDDANDPIGRHRVLIMPVMVLGGQHAEAIEERRRQRYAVIAGLGRRSFVPEIDSKIGFVTTQWCRDDRGMKLARAAGSNRGFKCLGSPSEVMHVDIPFEWYESATQHEMTGSGRAADLPTSVLVLWIDEISFLRQPSRMLAQLFNELSFQRPDYWSALLSMMMCPVCAPGLSSVVDWGHAPAISFKVIGPSTSSSLRFLLQEIASSTDGGASNQTSGIQFFSSRATRWEELFTFAEQRTFEALQETPVETSVSPSAKKINRMQLVVTISDDHTVLEAIIEELGRRGTFLLPNRGEARGHIAIIGEWDTHYGRALSRTLRAILCEQGGWPREQCLGMTTAEIDELTDNVEEFHYLRGIDGLIPGAKKKAESDPANTDSKQSALTVTQMEQPEGTSQLDYARRLAEKIAQRDRELRGSVSERGITAVGVAGSDLYDKQLILQALRSQLPNAVFFTTDLDARLFHPSQYGWSRNLIVGSSFGLTLRRELQGTIPPFRNVYQTSTFLATQLALGPLEVPVHDASTGGSSTIDDQVIDRQPVIDITDETIENFLGSPRIFEVARSGAFDISPDPADGVHPLHPPPTKRQPKIFVDPWAIVLLVVLPLALIPFSPPIRRLLFFWPNARQGGQSCPVRVRSVWWLPLVVVLLLFVLTAPGIEIVHGRGIFVVGLGLLGATIAVLVLEPNARRWLIQEREVAHSRTRALIFIQLVFIALFALLLLAIHLNARSSTGEPLALIQGISVWPTEVMRLIAIMVSIYFLFNAVLDLHCSNHDIESRYLVQHDGKPSEEAAANPGFTGDFLDQLRAWWTDFWRRRMVFGKPRPRNSGDQTGTQLTTNRTTSEHPVSVKAAWSEYMRQESNQRRTYRILVYLLVYAVFFGAVFSVLGGPPSPARSETARWLDGWLTFASALLLVVSALFVFDANLLTARLIKWFEHHHTSWPEEALRLAEHQRGIQNGEACEWLEIHLIAERSDVVGRFVIYPFLVLTILLLSRNALFDQWTWPLSLVLVFVVLFTFIIGSGVMLRRAAEAARKKSLRNLNDLLSRLKAGRIADDSEKKLDRDKKAGDTYASSENRIQLVGMVIDDIKSIRTGAFSPWTENPVLRAILLPFGGTGIMVLFELLNNMGM